ncbi:MAG: cupin-like domain-containing protein [Myxococcota bacterium]|nr:cupin-like domain-containing protein [Myxococcota bacterium]
MKDHAENISVTTLSDEWRSWLLDNLVMGAPAPVVADTLVQRGVPQSIVDAELARFTEPTVLSYIQEERRKHAHASQILALQRAHLDRLSGQIPVHDWPSASMFFESFYALNRPAIFRDVVQEWGVSDWTMDGLRARYGHVEITACVNRSASVQPDRDYAKHQTQLGLGHFIDRVQRSGHSNDLYLIANNHVLRDTKLSVLLDDVILDEAIFDPQRLSGSCSLWIGPAGTRTPLHHDVSNILLGQVEGSKRITLIPPQYADAFEWDGFYAQPAHPPFDRVPTLQTDLTAGDALFLPAGWLHHVEAMSPSVSFSLLCFRQPNSFPWFRPGDVST